MPKLIASIWVLLAATIIIIEEFIRIRERKKEVKREKMISGIINDFNELYPDQKPVSKTRWRELLKERHGLSDIDIVWCIEYLKKNGYIYDIPENISMSCWIRQ